MALIGRRRLLQGAAFSVLGAACAPQATLARGATTYEEFLHRPRPGAKKIVVFMPRTAQTQEVFTGLSDELGKEFELLAVRVETSADVAVLDMAIERHAPAAVVLMNNPTVSAYRSYAKASGRPVLPPAVIVMTSFLDAQLQAPQIRAATGIHYEVPLITVVTNLRKLIATPIERIGVVRRTPFAAFVQRQAELAARERIVVVAEQVSDTANASELKRALRRLRHQADVLWILNDDKLLTPRLIAEGWLPGLAERPWRPSIVGAASLVSPKQSFGTFAVLPDHVALGVQAAALVFDLAENDWVLREDMHTQLPLSTTTTIDLVQARERFSLRDDALAQVDHILQ